jgi:hypothetical protein
MELDERKVYEEEETTGEDLGSALMMVGVIFLLFDIFILLFVGRDIREGSYFFVVWEIVQAGLGVIFLGIGYRMKSRLHVKDDA